MSSDDARPDGTATTPEATPEATEALDENGAASHDQKFPDAFRAFMNTGWAVPRSRSVEVGDIASWTAKRRDRISEAFPGERIVLPSGSLKTRANDTEYAFRADSDFTWASGDQHPDAVLVLEPNTTGGHDAVLYHRPSPDKSQGEEFWRSRHGELWTGRRPSLSEVSTLLGLETRHLDELPGHLSSSVPTRVRPGTDATVASLTGTRQDADKRDAALATSLSELRLTKDAFEIEQLRDACAITHRGFSDVLAEMDQVRAYGERWIEGTFWRRCRAEGNDVGYSSICASGPHATTLHWTDNDGSVDPGVLMLLDMGAENRHLYTADVTRTMPVGGTFTPRQRELYSLVLSGQQAGIDAMRPGVPFLSAHRAAMEVITAGLGDMGLLPCSVEEALQPDSMVYRRWTLHGVSHSLGIDVHDCASASAEAYLDGDVAEGHVLTVEPGLYFQADDELVPEDLRGIGIRIEDDVLITADGAENLSAALPRDPDEIEAWMAQQDPSA